MNRNSACLTAPATTQTKRRTSGSPTNWIQRGIRSLAPGGIECPSYAAGWPYAGARSPETFR